MIHKRPLYDLTLISVLRHYKQSLYLVHIICTAVTQSLPAAVGHFEFSENRQYIALP